MLFNSLAFLLFFPLVLLVYYVLPQKLRKAWLLAASYYFYMCWNAKYFLLILFSTCITFIGSLAIDKINKTDENKARKRLVVIVVLVLNLGVLFVFKYFNFFFGKLFSVLALFDITVTSPVLNLLLPVGISFYTFQAISYTIDVYRGTVKCEKRFSNYALFVSFFPQLVAGPIERSENLLPQLDNLQGFNYDNFTNGLKIMLFGFFQKLVIADRVAVLVNVVYNNPQQYFTIDILIATVCFALQIYCDFAGYSNIAIGCARCMGIKLMKNFNAPYLSTSIKGFWRAWHISLSSWFADYLYIPLGGSRKGKLRTYVNVIIVFIVSGLWHGANLTFLVWGALHGCYQVLGALLLPLRLKLCKLLHINRELGVYKLFQTFIVFILVDFAWIFFRASSLSQAFLIINKIFALDTQSVFLEKFPSSGLTASDFFIIVFSVFVLLTLALVQKNIQLWRLLMVRLLF